LYFFPNWHQYETISSLAIANVVVRAPRHRIGAKWCVSSQHPFPPKIWIARPIKPLKAFGVWLFYHGNEILKASLIPTLSIFIGCRTITKHNGSWFLLSTGIKGAISCRNTTKKVSKVLCQKVFSFVLYVPDIIPKERCAIPINRIQCMNYGHRGP